MVRYFKDESGPVDTLCVFDLDGNFLASAWPVSWEENDHPVQKELAAKWEAMSPEARAELLKEEEEH